MNQVAFITGASRGIGLAIANALNQHGYDVIGTARGEFNFDPVNKNVKMISLQLDITSREEVKNLSSKLKEMDLMPNIIINNAGITSDQLFLRMSELDWIKLLILILMVFLMSLKPL